MRDIPIIISVTVNTTVSTPAANSHIALAFAPNVERIAIT
jgi:hypothetical protein